MVARYRIYGAGALPKREMTSNLLAVAFIMVSAALFPAPAVNAGQAADIEPVKQGTYESPRACSNCHARLYAQFEQSMHSRAFANPVFQSHVYNVLLPQAMENPELSHTAGACLACHSPTTFLTQSQRLPARNTLDENAPGVTCDFCHTMIGYRGSAPGNANYIPSPGPTKYGPFKFASDWHREYSVFQRKSEFCAVCHEATNEHGVQTRTTYSEWKTSPWPNKGIECQDCHMSASGRLIDGKPVFEAGKVAAAALLSPKEREKVYSHRFPGSNLHSQIQGGIKLRLGIFPEQVRPGSKVTIGIELDNSEVGHSMPTGSIELRLAWLDVRLRMRDSGREWRLKAKPDPHFRLDAGNASTDAVWAVAGMGPADKAVLGPDIMDGSRLYRAVVLNKEKQQTLNYWEATNKVFDNRLKAGETRLELFHSTLPADASGELEAEVTLRYLRYPPGFAKRLGITPAKSVMVARASEVIEIAP